MRNIEEVRESFDQGKMTCTFVLNGKEYKTDPFTFKTIAEQCKGWMTNGNKAGLRAIMYLGLHTGAIIELPTREVV